MTDRMPNDDDLLLFDVIELIKAYEEGLFARMSDAPPDEIFLTGYQSPLTGLESTITLSLLAADASMEEIVNSVTENRNDTQEDDTPQEEIKIVDAEVDHFYTECSRTDKDGNPTKETWDPQASVIKKNLDFMGEEPVEYEYKKRFTNEYSRKFVGKTNQWIEDHAGTVNIGDKKYKLDLENCLNCMLDYNVSLTLPSLEFVFNLTKFLRQIKKLLDDMLKAMDPTLLYDALCKFLLNFGANFMCPSNLIGLSLLLPTLFIKYSLDLAKIRFDWTGLFGGMVKAVLDFIVQAVEVIPKIVNPFLDCVVSAFRAIMGAIRAVVASGEKVTNEAISLVNQVGSAIQKVTPDSWFDKPSVDLQQEYDALSKDLREQYEEQLKEDARMRKEFEINTLPKELDKFAFWVFHVNHYDDPVTGPWSPISTDLMQSQLTTYLEIPGNEILKDYVTLFVKEIGALRALPGHIDSSFQLAKKYQKKIEAALAKETIEENKDFFSFDFVAETKTITTPYFKKPKKADKRMNLDLDGLGTEYTVSARDVSVKKSDWNALDYAFAKYGVDIKNEYRQPKDLIDYRAKGWVRSLNQSDAFQFIEKTIIESVITTKKWMNEEVAKVVQTLKALQAFMGEVIASEFKILGDLQAIAHLIRFIKLIIKFFEEGLSCENVRKEKALVEKIIQETDRNVQLETSTTTLNYDGKILEPEDYIKVKSLDNENIRIIDLTECSDLNSMLKVNKNNLDDIYEGILSGLST